MRMRIVTAGSGSGRECFGEELSMVSLVSLLADRDAAVVGAGIRKAKQEPVGLLSQNVVLIMDAAHFLYGFYRYIWHARLDCIFLRVFLVICGHYFYFLWP